MGIGGQPVTVVVDVANVMGSRPDGWWRDRAGAAVRLHADITRLAGSGRAILPDEPGEIGTERAGAPGFVMVLEGAAKAAAARLAPSEPNASPESEASPVRPGEVRVVQAAGSGDDAIVAVVRQLPGRRVVVTADRELRERCVAAGAEIRGPGWLLGLISGLLPACIRLSRTRCRPPGRQQCWSWVVFGPPGPFNRVAPLPLAGRHAGAPERES
jgi:hypothetical protein